MVQLRMYPSLPKSPRLLRTFPSLCLRIQRKPNVSTLLGTLDLYNIMISLNHSLIQSHHSFEWLQAYEWFQSYKDKYKGIQDKRIQVEWIQTIPWYVSYIRFKCIRLSLYNWKRILSFYFTHTSNHISIRIIIPFSQYLYQFEFWS